MVKVNKEVDDKAYYRDIHFLYEIFGSLKSIEEVKAFLKDMLTRSELIMLKRRWHIASLLYEGLDVRTVAQISQTSTQTVTRVKKVLEEGLRGLVTALQRVKEKQKKEKETYMHKKTRGGSLFVKGWFK